MGDQPYRRLPLLHRLGILPISGEVPRLATEIHNDVVENFGASELDNFKQTLDY